MILDILQWPDARLAQIADEATVDDGSVDAVIGWGSSTTYQAMSADAPWFSPNPDGSRPDLRAPCGPAECLLTDMVHTMMNRGPALGLAAPQIGRAVRAICVFEPRSGTVHAMLNPRIVRRGAARTFDLEGCLSVEEGMKRYPVRRAFTVTVEGLSPRGVKLRVDAKGQLAAAFQHEIDHLDGIVIADRTPPRRKRPLAVVPKAPEIT